MTPEQICAQFLDKNKTILHFGSDQRLPQYAEAQGYLQITDPINLDISSKYDYTVLVDTLELVDDPVSLIKQVKNLSETTVIYEFKYDDEFEVNPEWKQPWKTIGLEFLLTQEFDYVNDIFLGYATIHICKIPYNKELDKKEDENAIR